MKREETIDFNIKATWHAISRMYNQYGDKFEITASTGFVLLNIDTEEGTPATKIAPLMGLESRSLTRMLKTMEERNWVYRKKDPDDGRSVRIVLTDLGKKKREISRLAVKEFNRRVTDLISAEKLQTFFEVIHMINSVVDDRNHLHTFIDQLQYETSH
ncbi:MAG: MarR family transcriptional regulator [Bacteroidota bacterium]